MGKVPRVTDFIIEGKCHSSSELPSRMPKVGGKGSDQEGSTSSEELGIHQGLVPTGGGAKRGP